MIDRNPGDLLFVYGLLRKGAPHEMARLLEDKATYICTGRTRGLLYQISYYPGTILGKHNSWVTGDIYRIDNMDLWHQIDRFEGFPTNDEYRLVKAYVETNVASMKCLIYEFNRSTYGMQQITSGDFLQYLD